MNLLLCYRSKRSKVSIVNQQRQKPKLKAVYKNSKVFIEYSNNMDDTYENIDENNLKNKPKILDDMTSDMFSKKIFNQL